MFVNTLTTDDKYSLLDRDNLKQPIEMQLSQKERFVSNSFDLFWNLYQILNILKKRWPSQLIDFWS